MNAHERKILNFLNDVYLTTKDDYTKVTLQSFIKKHRVSVRYGKILNENFLHSKHSGQNNPSRLYKWRSIKPNLKMVNKARTEVRNDNSKSMTYPKNKIKPKKVQHKIKPKVKSDTHREEVIKEYRYKSISILWGLIKIKY